MNKVVVIGSLNMDIVLALTRLPKRGETLAVKDEFHNFGGKGANQAVAAARQGAQVAFIGAVGNDENGAAFQKLLAEENIDTKHVTVKQNITGSATILLEEDGHNTILVHGGANLALTATDVRAAEDVLAAADVVIAQLEVPGEAVAAGFKIAREHGALTILNPAPVTAQVTPDVLAYTDVIVPNETEAAALIDAEPTTGVATLEKTVYPAFNQQGLENVIVTLGADGVYYHVQNQQGHVPIFEAKVVDTTAAGDTFIGTLAANVTPDLANIDTILQRSSMASAIAVSRHGAIVSIPRKKEVDAALATNEKMTQDDNKKRAAQAAVQYIKDGMVVGLGTGSTVAYFLDALAEHKLDIIGVTTSTKTAQRSAELGIKIVDIDDVKQIDVTVDGADEVDAYMNGIKGGGAALLMEKIVANNSQKNIWIVDESKVHDVLGSFPLPVEVVPYGRGRLWQKFSERELNPVLRVDEKGQAIVTDGGHNIIDLHVKSIPNPQMLAEYLENEVGVVEHGLFLGMTDVVIIGGAEVKIKER